MKVAAQIISWLFMPLLIPALAMTIVLFLPTELSFTNYNSLYFWNVDAKKYLIGLFLFFGFVLPGFSVLIMRYSRMIESIELDSQRERLIPLLLTAIYSIFLILLLFKLQGGSIISAHLFGLAFAGLAMAIVFAIINQFFKISLHAGGAGMLLGFIFSYAIDQKVLVVWPIYVAIILGGLILASRLYLGKHTTKQAYWGFIFGSLITFIADLSCLAFI